MVLFLLYNLSTGTDRVGNVRIPYNDIASSDCNSIEIEIACLQ